MIDLNGGEPYSSVNLRANVPVIARSSFLFISLAVKIHWAVAGKQIIYRPATVKHRGEPEQAIPAPLDP